MLRPQNHENRKYKSWKSAWVGSQRKQRINWSPARESSTSMSKASKRTAWKGLLAYSDIRSQHAYQCDVNNNSNQKICSIQLKFCPEILSPFLNLCKCCTTGVDNNLQYTSLGTNCHYKIRFRHLNNQGSYLPVRKLVYKFFEKETGAQNLSIN